MILTYLFLPLQNLFALFTLHVVMGTSKFSIMVRILPVFLSYIY